MDSPPSTALEQPAAIPARLAKFLGSVVAPATLLAALLYYYGYVHDYFFYGYFGLNTSVLGLTPVEYISGSVQTLIVPVIIVAIVVLLAVWGDAALRARLAAGSGLRMLGVLIPVMLISGLVLVVGGLISAFATTALTKLIAGAPLSLAFGVLLLAYTIHLRRSRAEPAPIIVRLTGLQTVGRPGGETDRSVAET